MENLILNIVQSYFIIGVVLAFVLDICIRALQTSTVFSAKDILIVIMVWPIVVTTVVLDCFNGNF